MSKAPGVVSIMLYKKIGVIVDWNSFAMWFELLKLYCLFNKYPTLYNRNCNTHQMLLYFHICL